MLITNITNIIPLPNLEHLITDLEPDYRLLLHVDSARREVFVLDMGHSLPPGFNQINLGQCTLIGTLSPLASEIFIEECAAHEGVVGVLIDPTTFAIQFTTTLTQRVLH